MNDLRRATLAWLNGEAMACESCAVRLGGIKNDYISAESRDRNVEHLRMMAEMARYAVEAVESYNDKSPVLREEPRT